MNPNMQNIHGEEDQSNQSGVGEIISDSEIGESSSPWKRQKLILGGWAGGGNSGCGGSALPQQPCCLVDSCDADLRVCKKYHQRHKVCEAHAKAPVVIVDGLRQRFCQQCSRFHEVSEFDHMKRSCRRRLAGHNERRRKNSLESRNRAQAGDHSWRQLKEPTQMDSPGNQKLPLL